MGNETDRYILKITARTTVRTKTKTSDHNDTRDEKEFPSWRLPPPMVITYLAEYLKNYKQAIADLNGYLNTVASLYKFIAFICKKVVGLTPAGTKPLPFVGTKPMMLPPPALPEVDPKIGVAQTKTEIVEPKTFNVANETRKTRKTRNRKKRRYQKERKTPKEQEANNRKDDICDDRGLFVGCILIMIMQVQFIIHVHLDVKVENN
ncbi:hypothetical protein TSUD_313680 [Trifolium subterraneum]|uniref:Uncharacterized protein n=1 Tax=Trifolium subterraneum TaxID=3900 RepID=A0A2Z6N959_TRISU|nr:hypothetical protein TSUD_313680 [Trifolium subterraneum]